MRWINNLQLYLRSLLRRSRVEQDLDAELQFHLEQQVEENLAAGMSPEEARHAARRTFGNVSSLKEEARDTWGISFLETLWQDLRYGVRTLAQSPAFTAVAVLSLALGIGANTAIFSVVNAILLRPLPYEDPERIVLVSQVHTEGYGRYASAADYLAWEEENPVFERIAYWYDMDMTVVNGGLAQLVEGQGVSADLFSMLGVHPVLGRNFLPEDEEAGAAPTVILSHRLWERLFEKDPSVIGKNLRVNRENATVVGVMPHGFTFAYEKAQIWVAARASSRRSYAPVAGRLKAGVSIEQAQSAMETIAAWRGREYPETNGDWGVRVIPLRDAPFLGSGLRDRLLVFSCAVGCVLLIACANVGGLLLARSSSRQREIATRLALGASRWRLVRQLVTESMLLALAGGVLGIALAYGGLDVLLSFNPDSHQFGGGEFPRMNEASIDAGVLGYTLLVSLLTGLLSGTLPAFKGSRLNLNKSLKDASRGMTLDSGQQRLGSLLVVTQVALALVLLVGAGLMINSFLRLQAVDVGFNPDGLLTFRIDLRQGEYRNKLGSPDEFGEYSGDSQLTNFYRQVLGRVRAVPGVESAAAVPFLPLSHYTHSSHVGVDGRPPMDYEELGGWDKATRVRYNLVMGDYFQTLGIPLLRGRDFTSSDSTEAHGVVIINQKMARRHWPGEDPIGRQLVLRPRGMPAGKPLEVVGVVGDVHHWSLQNEAEAAVYVPRVQQQGNSSNRLLRMSFMARTASDPTALVPAVRAAVAEVDPEEPIYAVAPMKRLLLIWTSESRFYTLLLGVFAGLALTLSAIGVYGVIAHSVSRRTHEIGVRMALGAQSSEVLEAVMRRGVGLTITGVTLGLAGACTLTRLMGAFGLTTVQDLGEIESVLYGITPTDPATFVAVTIALMALALPACYIPARRATKVNPIVALRHE